MRNPSLRNEGSGRDGDLADANRDRSARGVALVFLGRDDLAALVHAGLQVDVVRPLQFAGFLVLDEGIGAQGVVRATHVAARGGGFALRNGHGRISQA